MNKQICVRGRRRGKKKQEKVETAVSAEEEGAGAHRGGCTSREASLSNQTLAGGWFDVCYITFTDLFFSCKWILLGTKTLCIDPNIKIKRKSKRKQWACTPYPCIIRSILNIPHIPSHVNMCISHLTDTISVLLYNMKSSQRGKRGWFMLPHEIRDVYLELDTTLEVGLHPFL